MEPELYEFEDDKGTVTLLTVDDVGEMLHRAVNSPSSRLWARNLDSLLLVQRVHQETLKETK